MESRHSDRRRFIKQLGGAAAGVLAAPMIIPSSALGLEGKVAPSNRIVMGLSGIGGRGGALLINFAALDDVQIVAVCDVKEPQRKNAQQRVNAHYGAEVCDAYVDFREITERDDIDAMAIATPDHWHVLQALAALRSGKDVYMEKPLGLSIAEGKALRETVHRYGRVLQFGTQERSSRNSRFACELVLNGRIGKLQHIEVGSRQSVVSENYPSMPAPETIDYDMWLGPAPWKPYTDKRVINEWWFHTSDYTLGFVSGCGVHTVDMAQMGHGTSRTGPVSVEGTAIYPPDGLCDCATDWDVTFTYADGVTMNFTDGTRNPLGVKFIGSDGWVFVKEEHLGGKIDSQPQSLLRDILGPEEIHLPYSNHHQGNFIDCVKTRTEPVAPVDIAVRSDALCQLTDIATRLGRKLQWDPEKEVFVNDEGANRWLNKAMRPPWRL